VSSPIGAGSGADLHLKLENQQHTGSFKARGAFNKLLSLEPAARSRGVIAASTGNHGAAVAYAARELGVVARVVVPGNADAGKVAAIAALGGEVLVHGTDSAIAEAHARALALSEELPFISPYNDLDVAAGQGTVGVEITRQLEGVDAVFIALGGGGLLAGIAAWLEVMLPEAAIIGCSPENSAVMIHSLRAGEILELESKPTLSDGTAGGVERGAVTFEWCRELADDLVTVGENEIRQAMRLVYETHGLAVEGAAGVAVAGFLGQAERWRSRRVVAIVCGGNVSPAVLRSVL
jgi:threonine dehydratase